MPPPARPQRARIEYRRTQGCATSPTPRSYATSSPQLSSARGRIDAVVSNAGYGVVGPAEELIDGQIDEVLATNLTEASIWPEPSLRTCGRSEVDASCRCRAWVRTWLHRVSLY